jgi:hypothetical protein
MEQVSISSGNGQTPCDHDSTTNLLNRLTLALAITKANRRRAEAGERPMTTNSLAIQAEGVATTTITRLARTDNKATSALFLDLASKITTVLDMGLRIFWMWLKDSA